MLGTWVALAPAPAVACNPLEALFGACRLDMFRPVYRPANFGARSHRSHRHDIGERGRRPHKAGARAENAAGISGKETPLEATPEAPVGSLALFRRDPTLRNGDIVVTNEGFRIYRRGRFVAIAHDGGRLARLERASMIEHKSGARRRGQSFADRRP